MRVQKVLLSCLLGLVFMLGCQPVATFYVGKTYDQVASVNLIAGHYPDSVWAAKDLNIQYEYKLDGKQLTLSGEVDLLPAYEAMYNIIKSLDIYLFIMDDSSRVLQTLALSKSVSTAMGVGTPGKFLKVIPLPASAKKISFGYRGELIETGGNGDEGSVSGASVFFSLLPD